MSFHSNTAEKNIKAVILAIVVTGVLIHLPMMDLTTIGIGTKQIIVLNQVGIDILTDISLETI